MHYKHTQIWRVFSTDTTKKNFKLELDEGFLNCSENARMGLARVLQQYTAKLWSNLCYSKPPAFHNIVSSSRMSQASLFFCTTRLWGPYVIAVPFFGVGCIETLKVLFLVMWKDSALINMVHM